jgi:ParB-like chromosome segregation protein Spo0J
MTRDIEERLELMGKKNTISVPDAYLPLIEDLRLLQSDQQNPNVTTIRQQEQIWASLQKYGWTYPIITSKDGTYADGEQRAKVCLEHGEFYAPVLRLPVGDVDRRMLRQILNKLRGKHNRELDAAEYMRIVEAGEKDYLQALLASVGEKLPNELLEREFSVVIPATYEIIVECKDEGDQKRIFEKLKLEGYRLRILTL